MSLAEGAALGILAGEPNTKAVGRNGGEASASAVDQSRGSLPVAISARESKSFLILGCG